MQSGRLRHRITIQQPTAGAADEYGAQIDTWSDWGRAWAEVHDLFGDEAVRAAQVTPEATVRVTMRYNAELDEAMRISFDGRLLYPVSLVPDDRKTTLTWMCKEER